MKGYTKGYTTERVIEIWNDKDGITHWEVGQDRDCFGLVEIREYDNENKVQGRLTFEREGAIKIAEAILEYCNDKRNFEEEK